MKTAAALPNRIGAGASFHGGGLSPTNREPALARAEDQGANVYGVASNDDARQPDAKDKLKEACGGESSSGD
jgi:carboxymethylenebutenolidase